MTQWCAYYLYSIYAYEHWHIIGVFFEPSCLREVRNLKLSELFKFKLPQSRCHACRQNYNFWNLIGCNLHESLSPLAASTFVQGRVLAFRLRLLPSPCTRWVVPCSCSFLPYPKFVISWLLSNTHPPSSLYSCTTLCQRTYSHKNSDFGSCGGLRPPVELLFRLLLRLSSLKSRLDSDMLITLVSPWQPWLRSEGPEVENIDRRRAMCGVMLVDRSYMERTSRLRAEVLHHAWTPILPWKKQRSCRSCMVMTASGDEEPNYTERQHSFQ